MKTCKKCKQEKTEDAFGKHSGFKSGLNSRCRECHNFENRVYARANREKRLQYNARYKKEHPEKGRLHRLRHKYGIELEDYHTLLRNQNGVCAICETKCKTQQMLCVDHDHLTNLVRGLLCRKCNSAIGNLKDSTALLRRAIDYLENAVNKNQITESIT